MAYNYRDEYGRERGSEDERRRREDERHGFGRGREQRGAPGYGSDAPQSDWGGRATNEEFGGGTHRQVGGDWYAGEDEDRRGRQGQRYGGAGSGRRGYGQDEFGQGYGQSGGFGSQGGYGQGSYSQGSYGQGSYGQSGGFGSQGGYGQGNYGQGGGYGQGGYGGYGREFRGYGQGGNDRGGAGSGYGGQGYWSGSQGSGYRGPGQWGGGQGMGESQRRGKGPKGYKRTDERIKEDLYERLMNQNRDIDASEVSIEVRDGKVSLEGTVPERWMKHVVEDFADGCPGVQDVENRIRVQSQSGAGSESASTSTFGAGSGASAATGRKKE